MEWMTDSPDVFYADRKGEKVIHLLLENDDTEPANFDIEIDYEARALHKVHMARQSDLEGGVYGEALYGTSVYG